MSKNIEIRNYFNDYCKRLNSLLEKVDIDILEQVINILVKTFKNGHTVYVCGNGGSAATSSHLHADFRFFIRNFTKFRPRVVSLTDNVAILTAVANDISFDDIFVEQLKGQFVNGDVIICISASGNSENVIRAARFANNNGGKSIGFVGFSGGELLKTASISLFTPNPQGDYGPIEDLHMIYDHLIVNYLSQDLEFLSIPEK